MECNNICRLCASPLTSGGVDLFSNGNVDYLRKIRVYFRLELLSDADVPLKMCGNCSFEFENIDGFKERCIQAQKSLETMLNKCHYRILSEDEVFNNPKVSESTTNVPPAQNQYMIVSNQPTATLKPNYGNSNSDFPRIGGVNEVNNFKTVQNRNMVMVNNHNQNNPLNISLQSVPMNGIGLPQTQFVVLNNQTGLQFQNENSTFNNHLQNLTVDQNNERHSSLNTSPELNNQLRSSLDASGQENVTEVNDALITPKMEASIKEELDTEDEDDDGGGDSDDNTALPSSVTVKKDDDDNSCVSDGGDNESFAVKNDHQSMPVTVDLVKKVKKEKLDVCEEMSSARGEKLDAVVELLHSNDELIVGMQMDDLLLKAVKSNVEDKRQLVSANDSSKNSVEDKLQLVSADDNSKSNVEDKRRLVSADDSSNAEYRDKYSQISREIEIFNLDNLKKMNKTSGTALQKMINAKVPVSQIVERYQNKNQEIIEVKNNPNTGNVLHNRNGMFVSTSMNLDKWFAKKMEESQCCRTSVISNIAYNSVIQQPNRQITPTNQAMIMSKSHVNSVIQLPDRQITPTNQAMIMTKSHVNQRREIIPNPAFINHFTSTNVAAGTPNVTAQIATVPRTNSNCSDSESKLKHLLQSSLLKNNKQIDIMSVRSSNRKNPSLKRKIEESDNKCSDPDYKPNTYDKFECPICDRRFRGDSYLMKHMRVHNTQ